VALSLYPSPYNYVCEREKWGEGINPDPHCPLCKVVVFAILLKAVEAGSLTDLSLYVSISGLTLYLSMYPYPYN